MKQAGRNPTMKTPLRCALSFALLSITLGSTPADAHHSFAMFDSTKQMTLVGTIRTVQWTNPHGYIWMYVPNSSGGQDVWGIEGASPEALQRKGWNKHSVNPGDKVTVLIHPLKDGRTGGSLMKLTRADGSFLGNGAVETPTTTQ
jgi:hypothetical protein